MWNNTREFTKGRWRRRGQRRLKMNLYFTYQSRDTLKSFILIIAIETVAKLNPGHSGKVEKKKFEKLAVVVYVLQTT